VRGNERHHPDYWIGEVKATQSFLPRSMTPADIADVIQEVFAQNREEIARHRSFVTRFPDQPIELLFTVDASTDTVTVELRYPGIGRPAKASIGRRELIDAIASAAEPVFRKLLELAPSNRDGYESVLRQIETLNHAGA
jgi:hypothetical protein